MTVIINKAKRGYLNIYTGQIVIPAQYQKAWIFSEGLGAVMKDNAIGFINKSGRVVIPFQYPYLETETNTPTRPLSFLFKNGTCAVQNATGKFGLIDQKGQWVVTPTYDYIENVTRGLHIVTQDGQQGVLDSTYNLILPFAYDNIVVNNYGIVAADEQGQRLLSYDGRTVLQQAVYDEVTHFYYPIPSVHKNGHPDQLISDYMEYTINQKYGILSPDLKPLTKAIYSRIDALDKNCFLCYLDGMCILVKGDARKYALKNL